MATFNEIINSDQPTLVDFYADWCGPCKTMAPILKQVVSEVGGKAKILKVNTDKNPAVASQYGIQSIPTLLLFKNGVIKWRQSGVIPAGQLLNTIKQFI